MRILKLPAKILYDVSDEFNKMFKNVFLCISIQIAARISTGKSDMAIDHCWICNKSTKEPINKSANQSGSVRLHWVIANPCSRSANASVSVVSSSLIHHAIFRDLCDLP